MNGRIMGTASPMQRKPANAKKGPTARARARRRVKQIAEETAIKAMVQKRDGDVCRVCGRRAESVHEITSKGAGGTVSLANSISVCGLLVGVQPSCHTYLQQQQIVVEATPDHCCDLVDANHQLRFVPKTAAARKWIESSPF